MMLKVCQSDERDDVSKFECALFSNFAEERESLFFGGDTVLRIKGIMQWVEDKLMQYDQFMEPINAFCRMINGLSLTEEAIVTRKVYKNAMKMLIRDILHCIILQSEKVQSPKYVHDLMTYHHESTTSISLLYRELLTAIEWMSAVFRTESGLHLSICNICTLFCHCESITFLMPNGYTLGPSECRILMDDLTEITKMDLSTSIRFLWPNQIPIKSKENIEEFMGLLYGTKWTMNYDQKSMVFVHGNASYGFRAQQIFESKIQYLISRLTPKPKKKHFKQRAHDQDVGDEVDDLVDDENDDFVILSEAELTAMAHQELLIVGYSRHCGLNCDDIVIPSLIIELSHLYFASYFYPEIGSRVRMKNRNNISRIFESVNRDDYQFWMKKYNEAVGTVTAHHITNGVEVEFQEQDGNTKSTKKIWYEPFCFSQIDGGIVKVETRYFVDDKVLWFKEPNRTTLKALKMRMERRDLVYVGKVGWIEPYEMETEKGIADCTNVISVSFAGHFHRVKHLPAECVKVSANIFGHDDDDQMTVEDNLSFSNFKVGQEVKVKADYAEVEAGFEMAGRDDCWDFMKPFCGQKGHIVRFHATNGVCVQLAYPQAIWYEPPCLEVLPEDEVNSAMGTHYGMIEDDDTDYRYHLEQRLFLGTKVKLSWKGHKYDGRVGKVVLHFPKIRNREGYKTVSVKFGTDGVQTLPSTITVVNKFYEL